MFDRSGGAHGLEAAGAVESALALLQRATSGSVEALDADVRVEALRAADRVVAWAEACRARLVAAVAGSAPACHGDDWGVAEVGAALRLTPRAAQSMVMTARRVVDDLPGVSAAWFRGDITGRHVAAFVDATAVLDAAATRAVEQRVLPGAPEQTVPEFTRRCLRAAMAVDPEAAHRRYERARRGRHVQARPCDPGMAWLGAYGPADEVARVFRTVDALAHAGEAADGIEAARFDALVALVVATATGRTAGREQGQRAVLRVTASLDTVEGRSEAPGEIDGLGPVPAPVVRRIAAEADWQRLLLDAGGRPVDVALPSRVPPEVAEALRAGLPSTRSTVLADFVRRWLRAPRRGHESDPAVHDPSAALRDLVLARDRRCRFPGCTRRAERCHIDHAVPHPEGPTDRRNCECLCAHHHRLKHVGGWRLSLAPDGAVTWRSPAGQTYVTLPEPYTGP